MEAFIYQLIEHINQFPRWSIYLATFASGLLQVVFPIFPGDLVLVLCGSVEYKKHIFQSLLLFFAYWSAIVTGNMALYFLGACKGEALARNRFLARFFTVEAKEKIKSWLSKYGILVFLAAIYIPGLYLPAVFFSGVLKYRKRDAFLGMMTATLVHDILLFLGGRYLGGNLSDVAGFISKYRNISFAVGLSAVVLFLLYRVFVYIWKKQQRQGV